MKDKNTTYSLGFTTMRDEVVDGNLHTFEMFQTLKSFTQQLKIERVRMVKVVLIFSSLVMLLISQHLHKVIVSCKAFERAA